MTRRKNPLVSVLLVGLLLTGMGWVAGCGGGGGGGGGGTLNSPQMGGSIQDSPLSLAGISSTLVGTAGISGSSDGTGSASSFNTPLGITTDGTNLFVADGQNNTIRKIVIGTGVTTTVAGTAGVSGSADGTGSAATFNTPFGITTDGTNLFVTDGNNYTIRKIVIGTGVVTTLAGSTGVSGSTDGTGGAATFYQPLGITTDGTNLFVADTGNHTIRKIVIATRAVTTLAGTAGSYGDADGTGSAALFASPTGITTDGANLFVADWYSSIIRKVVISTGAVTTVAGTAWSYGSANGTGAAATFYAPEGITMDGTNLFVTDSNTNIIRKIVVATGVVTTVAGTAGLTGSADGTGAGARFFGPSGITTDGTRLLIADKYNNTIRALQ